jgi:hypothetical protein
MQSNTAKLLGIDFDDVENDETLGLSPQVSISILFFCSSIICLVPHHNFFFAKELKELMESSDGNDYGEPDEDELMRSLSELGIEEASVQPSVDADKVNTPKTQVQIDNSKVAVTTPPSPTSTPIKSLETSSSKPAANNANNSSSLSSASQPPKPSPLSSASSSLSSASPTNHPKPPPVRYAATYKKEAQERKQPKPAKNDIFDELFDAFDFGRKAVVEVSVTVMPSSYVAFRR